MDYTEIGQRIRQYRRAKLLSQEQLAEKVDISTTHMSHIETGNTKLSLPVFVSIAEALSVHTDQLLYDMEGSSEELTKKALFQIVESCSPRQAEILLDTLIAVKTSLERHKR